MLTNYDAPKIVILKYTCIMLTEYVCINYDFVSIISCEHDSCVFINYDVVSIIICEHDQFVCTKYDVVSIIFVNIVYVDLQITSL